MKTDKQKGAHPLLDARPCRVYKLFNPADGLIRRLATQGFSLSLAPGRGCDKEPGQADPSPVRLIEAALTASMSTTTPIRSAHKPFLHDARDFFTVNPRAWSIYGLSFN